MEEIHAAFARLHEAIDEIFIVLRNKHLRRADRGGTDGDVQRAAERPAHLKIDVSAPTLAALLDEYEASRRTTDISDVHLANHMTGVRECVKDCGWVFPSQVTAPAIVGHLERRKALGNGPRRRNHVRSYILHFADWLAARGLIDKLNPKAIPRARVPHKRARYCPTRDEVVRLILAASQDWRKGDRWLVYLVAATTGLRTSTLKKLTPAMLKRGDGVAWLDLPASSLKTGVASRVWLTAEVATFLELTSSDSSGRLLRCVPKGDNFDRDLRAAGLDKRPDGEEGSFSPHSLRHFSATYLASADAFTLADRQAQMTHATPGMTEGVYTDHNSRALGEKIFRLQPLIPQGFTPNRGKRAPKNKGKVLEDHPGSRYLPPATFTQEANEPQPDTSSASPAPSRDERRCLLASDAGLADGVSSRGPPGRSEGTEAIGSNPITPIQGQFDPDLTEVIEAQGRQIHALNSLVRRLREELGRERQHRTIE